MSRRRLISVLLAVLAGTLPSCQQRMASQPSARPDRVSHFFEDGRTDRPIAPGTVPRGRLHSDLHLYTGGTAAPQDTPAMAAALLGAHHGHGQAALTAWLTVEPLHPVDTFPYPVTAEMLAHGKNRFMIYCVVCHDPLGTGHGMIVQRGYTNPPSLHLARLRAAPVGHFFQVMSLGYGSMPSYGKQIPPRDRWAIAAYVRALQLSQHFPERELTPPMRLAWDKQKRADAGGQP